MNEKILIADDEPYVLDVCRRILNEHYQVRIANNGLEAIQIARQERFDALLTDIKMPGMDGLETVGEIKKIQPDIVCVTMTAFSTMDAAIKALQSGVDEFVTKPFSPEDLILVVERALEKERLRKENIRLKSLLPLFEFNKSLMTTVDTHLLLEQALGLAVTETGANGAVLYMADSKGHLSCLMHKGVDSNHLQVIDASSKPLVDYMKNVAEQLALGKEFSTGYDYVLEALEIKSLVVNPLSGKERLLGAFLLFKNDQCFTQSERSFLSVMTGQVAVAYENAVLFEDLQSAYEELKTLDHMKSEFTNIAAHELRTPLAILMGYASVLEEDTEGIIKERLGVILRNSIRLRLLIEALVNMSNLQSGQSQLNISLVDVKEVITQMVFDMTILADKKGVSLDVRFEQPIPVIQSDRQKLELIITNLLTNAIKFSQTNGKVLIEGYQDSQDEIQISISDKGIGIPAKEFSKIFERFYQIEKSLNRQHDGIGLGLAIVKGTVEQCKGKVWVESEVGKGSKFTFTLPIRFPENNFGSLP